MKTWKKRIFNSLTFSLAAVVLTVLVVGFMGCKLPDEGDKNQTPAEADFIISGTGEFTYDGNAKTVTVTAKEKKTSGKITVKYGGNTTAPSAVGAYLVTFDETAAKGWNKAKDLPAGTLTINAATATVDDYDIDIDNLTQTAGSVSAITVTTKEGKSAGEITIYYEGIDGTAYEKSTTPPTEAGTYAVTFDVAAAEGWNAASGLSAGTLLINTPDNQTPTAADYDFGNLTQTAGNVSAVTITAKEGKSSGAVAIYYNGSTALPTAAGTYAVTFDVAEAEGWNPASGLSAGTLKINAAIPGNQTPTAGDYTISTNLNQTVGSVTAVTVTPKPGKSSGVVTVKYNNSTAVPSTVGTYTVTFDVAAVSGWNGASGLPAGTLTINPPGTPTPVAGDYDISGTIATYDGNPKTVTIQAKSGKSPGAVTVKYNNSTSAPTVVGTYTVTFDVAAASGWNGASGLSAGTLTIGNATPSAADYTFGNLTQTAGSVTAVTITPKSGKSTGAISIKYAGNAAIPQTAGTYAVTFNVAAATNWNPATDLSAGNLIIGSPANQTPTAADYDIGNLTQTFGSVSAVTVTPKTGKSPGDVTVKYDNSETLPTNVGTYTVTFDVAAASGWNGASGLSAGTLTINAAPTYSISLSQTGTYTFDALDSGYSTAPAALTITVTNTGNQATGDLTVSLGGTNSSSFTLSKTSINSIASNGTDTFTIGHNTGLAIGTYTATVTVSGGANITSQTFNVSFTVIDSAAPYIITGSGTSFTATRGGATIGTANQPIQDIIDAIRTHAAGNARTIQFGDGTAVLDIGAASASFNNTGGTWGLVTLTGKITSSTTTSDAGTVVIDNAVSVTNTADIANTGTGTNGRAVYNNSTGTLTISGGTVSATSGKAVYNNSTGGVNISGGTVSATTGTPVYNYSGGAVTISGGTVSTTTGYAVYNASSASSSYGPAITISGGTVSATTGSAVYNYSSGVVAISGGTVSARTGVAVYSIGKITVSGTAKVTSANTNSSYGTIYANSVEITGGTIENTANDENARTIYNASSGAVTISGGTVSATMGRAVYNASTGAVTISGGTVSATTGYAVYKASYGAITISGGTVSATTGYAVYNNFIGKITVSGTAKITSAGSSYERATITLSANGTDDAVRLEITGGTVENTAANGSAIYNNSSGAVTISGGTVSATTGYAVYNKGSDGKVRISGGTVSATTGYAVYNASSNSSSYGPAITISGGTVSATTGYAVYISTNTLTISGGTISATTGYAVSGSMITLNGSPTITGVIRLSAAGWLTTSAFNPGTKTYTLEYASYTDNNIAVAGGSNFLSNFTLYNQTTFYLTASGSNLIIASNVFTIDAIPAQPYTGSAITPTLTVKDGSTTLTLNTDYTVAYSNNINVGTATVTITGKGSYAGSTGSVTFTINPKVITFTVDAIPAQTYTGSAITPTVTVRDGSTQLTLTTDYTVSYNDNINPGTATVNVSGAGNYAGSTGSTTFTINGTYGISLSQTGTYTFATMDFGYSTAPAARTITVTNNGNQATGNLTVSLGGTNSSSFTLSKTSINSIAPNGTDTFTVRPNTGLAIGTYTATVTVSGGANITSRTFNVGFTVDNPATPYIITGSGTSFTATRNSTTIGTANQPIQTVINSIRTHATGKNPTIQFGNGTSVLNIGTASINFNNTGGTWGLVTLTGKITGSTTTSDAGTVVIANAVSVTSTADIANTGTGTNGRAVYNNSTGTVTISGGTVSATTGYTVYNNSTGALTISGGTVSATTGYAVYNNSTGNITVSGTAIVTSASTDEIGSGTIYIADSGTATTVRLEITGGTIENTSTGRAISNYSTGGALTISGGTVSATSGSAVRSISTGTINITGGTVSATSGYAVMSDWVNTINISGGTVSATLGSAVFISGTSKFTMSSSARITSANRNSSQGTIYLLFHPNFPEIQFEMTGGTVENTSTDTGCAIYCDKSGSTTINITGGTVTKAGSSTSGYAVYATTTGKVTITSPPAVINGQTYHCTFK